MKIVGIHQPNFVPHYPFLEKMAISDIFVIMSHCQFEKGKYQNRCWVNGRWWTNPVKKGIDYISNKKYTNGISLYEHNMAWIKVLAELLDIDTTKIREDWHTYKRGSDRIIEICKDVGATHYITNPEAFDKYLDRDVFAREGIEIIEHRTEHSYHTFEMLNKHDVRVLRNMLRTTAKRYRENCKTTISVHE